MDPETYHVLTLIGLALIIALLVIPFIRRP
jgi:hypothetical protein